MRPHDAVGRRETPTQLRPKAKGRVTSTKPSTGEIPWQPKVASRNEDSEQPRADDIRPNLIADALPKHAVPETTILPFLATPKSINLPTRESNDLVSIADVPPNTTIELVTNAEGLTLDGYKVRYTTDDEELVTIASVRVQNSVMEFQWADGVDAEGERSLRNSLIVLVSGTTRHSVALRQPAKVQADKMGLDKSILRLSSKCEFPPEIAAIRFDLNSHRNWPPFTKDGPDLVGMEVGRKVLLKYQGKYDAATEVRMRKSGKLAVVELESRYVLPSGDVEVMTTARGNQKINELTRCLNRASAAAGVVADLQRQATVLRRFLRSPRSYVPAQAAAASLANLEDAIAVQQGFIADRPGIQADLEEIGRVADLEAALKDAILAYRFYIVVGNEQIDLIVAE